MPLFQGEIDVIRRMSVEIEASDIQEARQRLNNLEFDPAEATEIVGWKVAPTLKPIAESRPYGEPVSALDLYKRQMKARLD